MYKSVLLKRDHHTGQSSSSRELKHTKQKLFNQNNPHRPHPTHHCLICSFGNQCKGLPHFR